MGKKDEQLNMVLSALASETRRSILHSLAFNPSTPSELAKESKMSLPGMHKHLAILEEADLVRRQKVGRVNFVALNADSLAVAQEWISKYHTHWGSRKETLENYITKYMNQSPGKDKG